MLSILASCPIRASSKARRAAVTISSMGSAPAQSSSSRWIDSPIPMMTGTRSPLCGRARSEWESSRSVTLGATRHLGRHDVEIALEVSVCVDEAGLFARQREVGEARLMQTDLGGAQHVGVL